MPPIKREREEVCTGTGEERGEREAWRTGAPPYREREDEVCAGTGRRRGGRRCVCVCACMHACLCVCLYSPACASESFLTTLAEYHPSQKTLLNHT